MKTRLPHRTSTVHFRSTVYVRQQHCSTVQSDLSPPRQVEKSKQITLQDLVLIFAVKSIWVSKTGRCTDLQNEYCEVLLFPECKGNLCISVWCWLVAQCSAAFQCIKKHVIAGLDGCTFCRRCYLQSGPICSGGSSLKAFTHGVPFCVCVCVCN